MGRADLFAIVGVGSLDYDEDGEPPVLFEEMLADSAQRDCTSWALRQLQAREEPRADGFWRLLIYVAHRWASGPCAPAGPSDEVKLLTEIRR